jgi:hypothetical protein
MAIQVVKNKPVWFQSLFVHEACYALAAFEAVVVKNDKSTSDEP